MTPFTYLLATDPDDQFTDALATNAVENENLVLPGSLAGVNGAAQGYVRSITIVSDQNLSWELQWYQADTFQNADPEVDSFLSYWLFAAADGVQVAGTGLYRYYVDGLAIPYRDSDGSGEMHLSLVNRSATSKNAGATGEIKVTLGVEPMGN